MPNIQIGTAGFSYDDWSGPFYPPNMKKERYLSHYAKYFTIIETNSTHYSIPRASTLKKWATSVPERFKFCIKVWNQVTHIKDYGLGIQNMQLFLNAMKPIQSKVACFLLQFPPSFKKTDDHSKYIREILNSIDSEIKIAVELRDNSWFDPSVLKPLLNGKNQILGTVYLNKILPYYPEWQESYYIRVIGDRSLTKFDKVQRENIETWTHLTEFVTKHTENTDIVDIFVIFNNHFSGFSPTDSNRFKQSLNLPFKDFSNRKSIIDFF